MSLSPLVGSLLHLWNPHRATVSLAVARPHPDLPNSRCPVLLLGISDGGFRSYLSTVSCQQHLWVHLVLVCSGQTLK